ncbi:MAG: class I SAM-dependent methyltransferase [Candidatus Staskawiczbacteria bacterium]|nr:class I SAM-dependent methyltransferase [Candidatus Staskawiczbacteria bacterium]
MQTGNLTLSVKNSWENLHSKARFQPKYPSDHVVRFVFSNFPADFNKRKKIKILDLGCGAGCHTVFLAKEGFKTYATDISENGINVTKKRLNEKKLKADLKKALMENQPFPDDFFDAVISFGVFYYNSGSGYKKAVDGLYRILKEGGLAFIFTRTTDDYRFGKGKEIEKNTFVLDIEDTNEKGMQMHFLDKKDIRKIFKKFREIAVEKTETTFSNSKKKNSDWIITLKK